MIIEISTGECVLDQLEMRFFESPKFHKKAEDLETLSDIWMYFFMKFDYITGHIPEVFKRHEVVMKALNEIDSLNELHQVFHQD